MGDYCVVLVGDKKLSDEWCQMLLNESKTSSEKSYPIQKRFFQKFFKGHNWVYFAIFGLF